MPLWKKNQKIYFSPRAEHFLDTQYKILFKSFCFYEEKNLLKTLVEIILDIIIFFYLILFK